MALDGVPALRTVVAARGLVRRQRKKRHGPMMKLNRAHFFIAGLAFAGLPAILAGCSGSGAPRSASPTMTSARTESVDSDEARSNRFSDFFVQGEKLSYHGLSVERRFGKFRDATTGDAFDASYVVVKKGDRVVKRCDGVFFGGGNASDFGVCPPLNRESGRLIVSQTIPRHGRHWVIEASPKFRVAFDSGEYEVGDEDGEILDIDQDGAAEIVLSVGSFHDAFSGLPISSAPRPKVIFQYDARVGKYLPANRTFQARLLEKIDRDVRDRSGTERTSPPSVLATTLDFLYAGAEAEGWSYFERECPNSPEPFAPNKTAARLTIRTILRRSPAYQFIRAHGRPTPASGGARRVTR
jgi:hypothetical protein